MSTQKTGSIGWADLTVPNATEVRDFYAAVVGFTHSAVNMGDYEDFCMIPPESEDAVCGVCHARGSNADQPPVWMIYFIVKDIQKSIDTCNARGGSVIVGPKKLGAASYCVIKDPAGAVCALYQP